MLAKSRTAFTNAPDAAALAPFGYTAARFDDLLDLVEDVAATLAHAGQAEVRERLSLLKRS